MYTCSIQSFKILASFCSWAGWFKSYLVENPRRHIFAWRGSYNKDKEIKRNSLFVISDFNEYIHYARRYYVQRKDTCPAVIPRICACVKQILIGWKLVFGYMVQWQYSCSDTSHSGRPTNNSLSLYDVSAATGPCIQKSTFNRSELVKLTRKFAESPLDMYHSVGHVSHCILVWNMSCYDSHVCRIFKLLSLWNVEGTFIEKWNRIWTNILVHN